MPRRFWQTVSIFFVLFLIYIAFLFINQWDYERVGNFEIRRNKITGTAQIKDGNAYRTPFDNDNYAPGADENALRLVKIDNVFWGKDGALCGIAHTGNLDVKGRLAFQIIVTGKDGLRIRNERSLRRTVDWAANRTIPIILATGQETPTRRDAVTSIRLETMYNSENVGETLTKKSPR